MGSTSGLDRTKERNPSVEDNWQLANAVDKIAETRVPKLHGNNRHERLFYAMFDGSNQTRDRVQNAQDGKVRTAVGYFADALEVSGRKHGIAVGYQTGVGAEGNALERIRGLADGTGAVEKIERQYERMCQQMAEWRKEDPQAQLRVVGMGFSRGGDQAAAFLRLVHERGVLQPGSKTQYLVEPGKVPQAALLLDPVATGALENTDRRLPSSTLYGVQVVSRDERRAGFDSNPILPDGQSKDGRYLSVTVPGGHGDTAHGHAKDAASVRIENALVDVVNGFSGKRILEKVPQSKDAYSKLHDTQWNLPTTLGELFGDTDPGARKARMSLAPESKCEQDPKACYRVDPVDTTMQKQFHYRPQEHAPVRETNGPGHVSIDPLHDTLQSPGLKPVLHSAIAVMEGLKTRHPELAHMSAPQLATGAMNHWKSTGAQGMFTEVALARGQNGQTNVVLSDSATMGPAARREPTTLEALTRVGFEEGLAQLVQAQSDERNLQLKQAQLNTLAQPKHALMI